MTELQAVPTEHEQLVLVEGFNPEGTRFALSSATNVWTDHKLAYKQAVSGSFAGTVTGYKSKDESGKIVHVYIISVLDAVLD